MLTFLARRFFYGLTVLFGVVTLVFFLFTMVPDPARELAGQAESEELVASIRRKFNLDLPASQRYLLFLNDLSPVSLHAQRADGRSHRLEGSMSETTLMRGERFRTVVKWPYLGRSWMTERGVGELLAAALPGTFMLAALAMAFAMAIGLVLGFVSARNKDTALDRFILLVASVGMSGPSFFVAILFAWLFGYVWHEVFAFSLWLILAPAVAVVLRFVVVRLRGSSQLSALSVIMIGVISGSLLALWAHRLGVSSLTVMLPGTGLPMSGSLYAVDVWKGQVLAPAHIILPVLTLGIRPLAVITQLTRNSVLEVLGQDYIRTARAKGLSEPVIMLRHVLRNALNPVITAASGWLASMLAGAVFVEYVFGWKGLGLEVFRSLEKNDLPVVMGAVMVVAAVFVVINTLVDLVYGWVDPRVRIR